MTHPSGQPPLPVELTLCGSGKGGWAWSARRGEEPLAEGAGGEQGSAYRMGFCALVDALEHLSGGGPLELRHRNALQVDVLQKYMPRWEQEGWPSDKQAIDLVRRLPALLAGWELHCTEIERTDPTYKQAKRAAQEAAVGVAPREAADTQLRDIEPPAAMGESVVLWTDGGCRSNPGGVGGWGFVLVHWPSGTTLERWGGDPDTTNNRMELTAAIEGLRALTRPGLRVEVRADSTYVIQVATSWGPAWRRRGWRKRSDEPIANLDLVQELDRLVQSQRVRWTSVKGHAGEAGNERVDALANRAMDAAQAGESDSGE